MILFYKDVDYVRYDYERNYGNDMGIFMAISVVFGICIAYSSWYWLTILTSLILSFYFLMIRPPMIRHKSCWAIKVIGHFIFYADRTRMWLITPEEVAQNGAIGSRRIDSLEDVCDKGMCFEMLFALKEFCDPSRKTFTERLKGQVVVPEKALDIIRRNIIKVERILSFTSILGKIWYLMIFVYVLAVPLIGIQLFRLGFVEWEETVVYGVVGTYLVLAVLHYSIYKVFIEKRTFQILTDLDEYLLLMQYKSVFFCRLKEIQKVVIDTNKLSITNNSSAFEIHSPSECNNKLLEIFQKTIPGKVFISREI
jgi:hypothetical protein